MASLCLGRLLPCAVRASSSGSSLLASRQGASRRLAFLPPSCIATLPHRPYSTSAGPVAARGVTRDQGGEHAAEVRVDDVKLLSHGEPTPAHPRARDAEDAEAARPSGNEPRRTAYQQSSTRTSSPVPLSEEQDEHLGHLTSTTSHLLRLTLPLPSPAQPVAFVLHPAQPLSYLSRLIAAELPSTLPDVQAVQYRGFGDRANTRWCPSTDISDFLRQAANIKSFQIDLLPALPPSSQGKTEYPAPIKSIRVTVPSFLARTRYLRERLQRINDQLKSMADLKAECDELAKRGARRVALGGLAGLVVYWITVAAATAKLGWDIMEPITYLVGQSVLISGYTYYLLHRREPGYDDIFKRTRSYRQARLYAERGFDYDRHQALIAAGRTLRTEIRSLADEYGVEWDERAREGREGSEGGKGEVVQAVKESEELERQSKVRSSLKTEGKTKQDEEEEEEDEEELADEDTDAGESDGRTGRAGREKDLVRKELKKLKRKQKEEKAD